MDTCRYHGREICAYDLKDEDGLYDQEYVLELKRAAAQGELFCTECQKKVYLAAGLIKEPYFAHYDLEACSYQNAAESEESKTAKRLLYQLAKRSFAEQRIEMRFRQEKGFYSTIVILKDEKPAIAIDYQMIMLPIKELEERLAFYKENQIASLIVLSNRQVSALEQLNWYQTFLTQQLGYCVILNAYQEKITVKRSFVGAVSRFKQARVFQEGYPIRELSIAQDGTLSIQFLAECEAKEAEIISNLEQMAINDAMQHQRKSEFLMEQIKRIAVEVDFTKAEPGHGIRKDILEQCLEMIRNGDSSLVSEKYLKYILSFYSELKKK